MTRVAAAHLLAVHLGDETAKGSRVGRSQVSKLATDASLADCPDLVDRNLSLAARNPDPKTRSPTRVELGGQWTYRYSLQSVVQCIEADNDDGPRLRHFGAPGGIEHCPAHFVPLQGWGRRFEALARLTYSRAGSATRRGR